MLDLMRKHARNWMMKVILFMVIVVFILYFGSLGGLDRAETVAFLDDKPISYAEFLREYQNMVELYQQRLGSRLTPEVLKGLNLKQQALDGLVDQAIIQRMARDFGIAVTDEEVRSSIFSSPFFQRQGSFDEERYRYFLRARRMTSDEFETQQRLFLTAARLESIIADAAKVSDKELYDLYRIRNEKINLQYITLNPASYEQRVSPSEKDLEQYLLEHGGEFRVPEQIQVRCIAFFGDDYAATAQISAEEVASSYDQQKSRWTSRGKVKPLDEVRDQIVRELKHTQGMFVASQEAKKAHDTIYQQENFRGYAAEAKLRVTTTEFFPLNSPPREFSGIPDFIKKVVALQSKEVSPLLSDEKGYYLCEVAARKPAFVPPLKDVRENVEKRWRAVRARQLCREQADAFLARLRQGEDMAALARKENLHLAETGLVAAGSSLPGIGFSPELGEALYRLSSGKPYPEKVFEIGGSLAIIRLKAWGGVDDGAFAAEKENLEKAALSMKRGELIRGWLQENKALLIKEGKLKFTREMKDL